MYKITSSEERNEKATEFETKSLLYMMNYYNNSEEIHWFAIDFFNDVTGINKFQDTCYDIQSKGVKNIQPMQLGRYLVTLFKNFISEFNFAEFILFIDSVSTTIKNEISSNTFVYNDMPQIVKDSIKDGLIDEANKKSYIVDKSKINNKNLDIFFEKVIFVINDKSKEDYIKDAVNLSDSVIVDNKYLLKIFKEIRNKQSSKKNNNVEGEILTSIGCFYKYDKHLTKDEIEDLIINRICFNSALKDLKKVPKDFAKLIKDIDVTIFDEEIEKSQDAVFRLLSDKNNKKAYWELFSNIVFCIKENSNLNLDEIYNNIDKNKIQAVRHLDVISCKYFISLIKESIK